MKPRILITNDDGIDTFFLRMLVEAHKDDFDVMVAAPAGERSWIGRAMTRVGEVEVSAYHDLGCAAWKINGTPADCVNIALGNLIGKDEWPDIVISGINIGQNASVPFILSSGTIGGALEGALWGLPAVAYSQMIPSELYEGIRSRLGYVDGGFEAVIKASAKRANRLSKQLMNEQGEGLIVHNINFPEQMDENTAIERTVPDWFRVGSLFERASHSSYRFKFSHKREAVRVSENSERTCLLRGSISHSQLDFSELGG